MGGDETKAQQTESGVATSTHPATRTTSDVPTYRKSSSHLIFALVRKYGDVSVAMSTKSIVKGTSLQNSLSKSPSIAIVVSHSSDDEDDEEDDGSEGGARRATYCLGYAAA